MIAFSKHNGHGCLKIQFKWGASCKENIPWIYKYKDQTCPLANIFTVYSCILPESIK